MSIHERQNRFKSGYHSVCAFPVPPDHLPGMDKKMAKLYRVFFMGLSQIKPYSSHILNLSDRQINLNQGMFSHVLDVLKTDLKSNQYMYLPMNLFHLTKTMFKNVQENVHNNIEKMGNAQYSLNKVMVYVSDIRAFLSLYSLAKTIQKSDAKSFKKLMIEMDNFYGQCESHYEKVKSDKVIIALCETSPMMEWSDLEKQEDEAVIADAKKPYIDFNTWDIEKLSTMLGYKHDFARYDVEIVKGKKGERVKLLHPLGKDSVRFIKETVSDFMDKYCQCMELNSALGEIKRQIAIASFYAFNESLIECSKDGYVENYVRKSQEENKYNHYSKKTPEEARQQAKSIKKHAIERSNSTIKGIGEIKSIINNLFNHEEVSLTFKKDGEKYIGAFNKDSDKVMCCIPVEKDHIQACLVSREDYKLISDFESFQKMGHNFCSFHNIETLVGEMQSDFALNYFFPELTKTQQICITLSD